MNKRRKRGGKFVYLDKARMEGTKRRIIADEERIKFDDAIKQAYEKRDPSPLCDYLRSNRALTEEPRDSPSLLRL